MAFSFPTSPTNGDIYSQGPVTFTYNSTIDAWVAAGTGVLSLPTGTTAGQVIHWNGTAWDAGTDSARNIITAEAGTPTTRDDGTPLVQGDIYTNTGTSKIMLWTGAAWVESTVSIDDLVNVNTSGATIGQVLTWSGTTWVPTTVSGGGGSTLASGITYVPTGNITATNVQDAIDELDSEKLAMVGGTISGNLAVTGNLTVSGNTSLGAVTKVSITGGTSGQVLSTNGSGVLSWSSAGGPTTGVITGTAAYDYQVGAAAPTTRSVAGLSAALVTGDKYFDTVQQAEFTWNGTKWVSAVVRTKSYFFSGF